ncbi:MAG: putative zinc-binding metallopeptidase [Acidobacteria bacterium]|nr:putative zinc-binding metallopeptidase [Acidobacteriota bacterium]
MKKVKRTRRRRQRNPFWAHLSDEDLLDLRFSDLNLKIEQSDLQPLIQRLYSELERRGLQLRPPCWLSSEWFSPHDLPGIAIPFYLAHPRLRSLERRMMKEVEGGTRSSCMKLLRHEAGHAYEAAYRMGLRRRWARLFGRSSEAYPKYYSPNPQSKSYVLHLDWWYAQSHPVEDFAETFAVWLRPGSDWRDRYRDWPALKKLEYVDALMAELRGTPPLVKPGPPMDPLHRLRQKLREHYQEKHARYNVDPPRFYDMDLLRLFPPSLRPDSRPPAAGFLHRISPRLRQRVASWTGEHAYVVNQVLKDMMQQCRELDLRVSRRKRETLLETAIMLTKRTMNFLNSRGHRLAI